MNNDVYEVLDELAARGRRLRGQLPGDYKPLETGDPMADVLARAYAMVMSWQAGDDPAQEVRRANAG